MPAELPTIDPADVVLRALRPSDEDAVYSLLSDERVIRYMLFPRFDRTRAAAFTARFQSSEPTGSPLQTVFAIAPANAEQVVGLCGLVLDASQQQAGNGRVRKMATEIAWGWLRYQPNREITRWFERRFGNAGKRARRRGIVAVARKILVALRRYLDFGEIPKGASLKTG